MTKAIALKEAAIHVKALEKATTRAICLGKWQAMPVKALEKAMARAIALKNGRRFMSKPWKRQ